MCNCTLCGGKIDPMDISNPGLMPSFYNWAICWDCLEEIIELMLEDDNMPMKDELSSLLLATNRIGLKGNS